MLHQITFFKKICTSPIFFILKKHYFRNKKNRLVRFFLKSNIICTLRCYSSVQSYKKFYRRKHEKNAFVLGGMTYVEKNPDFKFHARQADNITKDRACIFVTFRVRFVLAQKAKNCVRWNCCSFSWIILLR
jgi:hypothetical protein